MIVRFSTKRTEELYTREKGANAYPDEVIQAFFVRLASLRSARDKKDLLALKSLGLTRSVGDDEAHSVRLFGEWQLILSFDHSDPEVTAVVEGIRKNNGDIA